MSLPVPEITEIALSRVPSGLPANRNLSGFDDGISPVKLPASKLSTLSCANSSPASPCSIGKVNARATDRVNCVFHAPFTLPSCK